jgi:hypothetical protein
MAELERLDPRWWTPEPVLLAVSCVLLFGGYAASAAVWAVMVRDLGGPRLPPWQAVRLFMIANLGRYVPGKVWQIAGLAALARGRGVPAAVATGAAVLGQGIALVAASAVGLGALVGGPTELTTWAPWAAGAVAVAVGVGLFPPVFRPVASLWFRLARQEEPELPGTGRAALWLLLYGLNWILYALSFWVLARSLGVEAPVVPLASAFAAAYVLGYLMIFAPAGVGVREGFLVALLTPWIGAAPAGALAVLARIWTTVVEVVPAALFWVRHLAGGAGERRGAGEPPAPGAGREGETRE